MDEKIKKKKIAVKQFLIFLLSKKSIHITDIITEIRAIKGVITVSIFEKTRKISEERNLSKIKVKFLQFSEVIDENIKDLKKDILKIEGVESVIIKMKKTDMDAQVSDMYDRSNIPHV